MTLPLHKLGFSIPEWVEASSVGRSTTFEEIKAGRLRARKLGKRTIITRADGEAFLASLPLVEPEGGAR